MDRIYEAGYEQNNSLAEAGTQPKRAIHQNPVAFGLMRAPDDV